jgi:hypothetical protein
MRRAADESREAYFNLARRGEVVEQVEWVE